MQKEIKVARLIKKNKATTACFSLQISFILVMNMCFSIATALQTALSQTET